MFADLHLHSQYSDGTLTPEELALRGASRGYGLLAVCDHSRWQSWPRFSAACRREGVIPLRGMEMDCLYDGRDIHILAYGFTPTPGLTALAEESRRLLLEMSHDLVRRLLPDFPQLSWAEYRAYPFDRSKGGWQCLHYLAAKGAAASPEDAMSLYARYGCDYGDYPFPPAAQVCREILLAGGTPVLAHPGNWFAALDQAALFAHLDALRALGIRGVECHYPTHTPAFTALCEQWCREHDMLITAGSDCHGDFHRIHKDTVFDIGQVRVPPEHLRLGNLLKEDDLL